MATRLHVGGLGERVKEEDLRNTFCHLGTIQTVEIIRTKGRSFAYINFLPSSENSLAKVFSTYNGCLWKGGKLKLEKAKEHYIDRLKQEWAEDAELVNSEDSNTTQNDVDENMSAFSEPKSTLDSEKMQLRMFFPKLRKVKALPLRGTGKHKYSFQRVVVPPLPVHFCDCPEHCVDIQSDKINDKEINMTNSVMSKLLNKETFLKSGCIQPSRGAQVRDSRIQDDGMNEEEIQVMNSVMKKLLEREIAKTERRDLNDSPQITAPTVELQEDNNQIDEETDDDDIKINTGAGQDFGPENWELQTSLLNKMARSDEQWTSDEPAKSKLGTHNRQVKLSSQKRKSVSNESNEKDPASLIRGKKVHFQTQLNESEEHLELKSVTGSEANKSIISGMRSQKSSWKKLVGDGSSGSFHLSDVLPGGDGSSGSFHLSHVTPGGETNIDEHPVSDGETSTHSRKHKRDSNVVNEEHKPSNKTLSVSKELERVSNYVPENLDGQLSQLKDSEGLQAAQLAGPSAEEHKPSNKTLSVSKELVRVSNYVPENLDGQLSQLKDSEGLQAAHPAGPSASLDKATRGSSWLQKSSWTQLVGGGKSSSFSISQILPGDLLEKQKLNKSSDSGTSNSFFSSATAFGGTRRSRSCLAVEDKKKDAQASAARGIHLSKAPKDNDCSDSTISKKSDLEQKKVSNPLPGVGISETCPFMRSADSLKDWQTAKTTLTSSHKKRNNNKQGFAL